MAFEVYDLGEIYEQFFDVQKSEAIDINFMATGYETSDTI